MRIISGTFKARRIQAPKKLPVRPTTDMAKEALFNILNHRYHFHDISVLDLFSGTGNISYEFASRGTESIVAVDQNFQCTKFITQTSEGFDMPIQVIKAEVFGFLEKTKQSQTIIFADPPYDLELDKFLKIVELVFQNELLETDGVLIIEHSKQTDLSSAPQFTEVKGYGGNRFSFFEN
ncbi:MAG: RsmD family RNA methyltransferase [Flavobacteriaceae bacterium]|jgi:16S rRNA (guanine(966)-N(2))-methyltransferase RsmD|nr:RsmD family RNA methyltransferase [Flavobacteriaceae bacterium]MDG1042968.1 RsmD family RNA methyltransferase [Flavobacteriaceae bacterium]MDG1793285.1 RsmD family RNA methyltransferase [Flavobacteriaceae bacterium]